MVTNKYAFDEYEQKKKEATKFITDDNENNKDSSHDVKFFQNWKDSLRKKLDVILPGDLPSSVFDTFTESCSSIETIDSSLQKANKLRNEISKKKPIDNDEIENINDLINTLRDSLEQGRKVCQKVAKPILEDNDIIQKILSDDFNDIDLITYVALDQGGVDKLASWCQSSKQHETELMKVFQDPDMLRTFLQAGGPRKGEYGRACEIYYALKKYQSSTSKLSSSSTCMVYDNNYPVLERLILAISLELASPRATFNLYKDQINPITRYEHYEKAYLLGILDPSFSKFTVWELRHVINCDSSEEQLNWGRKCLMNYRPDLAIFPDLKWRYCKIVSTDVNYKHPDWYKKEPSYDQILSGGGECGPRAWYGRFICKAFGIPTWGVRQPGHAAMARWTPDNGWTICLGAGFEYSTWESRNGFDFQLETLARARTRATVSCLDQNKNIDNDTTYMEKVMRLEWIASYKGETNINIYQRFLPDSKNVWYSLAMMQRHRMASAPVSAPETCSSGADKKILHPHSKIEMLINSNIEDLYERQFSYEEDGTIIIPGTSCISPSKNTKNVIFMKSFLGGTQLFIGDKADITYELACCGNDSFLRKLPNNPTTTKYKLSLQLCTVHRGETPLLLTISTTHSADEWDKDSLSVCEVPIPYTEGMWVETDSIIIDLAGDDGSTFDASTAKAQLCFTRQSTIGGISLKYIKLTPA